MPSTTAGTRPGTKATPAPTAATLRQLEARHDRLYNAFIKAHVAEDRAMTDWLNARIELETARAGQMRNNKGGNDAGG